MRLIDADKLEELCDIMAEKCGENGESIWNQFRTVVECSPTVDVPERNAGKWIPVTERLPEADNRVLICNDKGRYMVGFIKSWRWGNEWSYQCNMYDYDAYDEREQGKLVAWMPLPEPYREETDNG